MKYRKKQKNILNQTNIFINHLAKKYLIIIIIVILIRIIMEITILIKINILLLLKQKTINIFL